MRRARRKPWSTKRPVMWTARKGSQVLYLGCRPGPAMRCAAPGVVITRNGRVVYPPAEELQY